MNQMFYKLLLLIFSISAVLSAIIPLPNPPSPIPEPPTVDDSPSLTFENRGPAALEVTSSAHHLPRKENKVSRNRVRLHSHNSKVSKVSRTREVEILNEKCNNEKLQEIMQDAITPSLSTSKMVISERATRDFGVNFDVICARGHFSYYVETTAYCEVTLNDITCLAYKPTSESEKEMEDSIDITEQLIKNRRLKEKEEDEAKLNR
ncbi:unnamed protein product [Caenorhabditis brenneri]